MTSELDLIRRLVQQLQRLQDRDGMSVHAAAWYSSDPDHKCSCILCEAQQYLSWRESPAVEDPASDAVEFEKIVP